MTIEVNELNIYKDENELSMMMMMRIVRIRTNFYGEKGLMDMIFPIIVMLCFIIGVNTPGQNEGLVEE